MVSVRRPTILLQIIRIRVRQTPACSSSGGVAPQDVGERRAVLGEHGRPFPYALLACLRLVVGGFARRETWGSPTSPHLGRRPRSNSPAQLVDNHALRKVGVVSPLVDVHLRMLRIVRFAATLLRWFRPRPSVGCKRRPGFLL